MIYSIIPIILFTHYLLLLYFPYPRVSIAKQIQAINFKETPIKLLHMGHSYTICDLLWLDTLLFSDTDHYNKKDLSSWMFLRFSTIVALDPKFLKAYQLGGLYLSVIKNDNYGAKALYEKGIKMYPDDFQLNYQLGQLYLFEIFNPKLSYHYFSKVVHDSRAPFFLSSILARLAANMQLLDLAIDITHDNFEKHKNNPDLALRYKDMLYSLYAQRDLECLNSKKSDCATKDLYGENYIQANGVFKAPKPWKPIALQKMK